MAVRIADLFANHASHLGSTVTVQGWVRTRRDSKAGISFVAITDGSCFDTVQAVVLWQPSHEAEVGICVAGFDSPGPPPLWQLEQVDRSAAWCE